MAELFKVNAPVRKPLFEGVQGENEARSIQFDITPWVEELGDGAVTATAKRSQDSQPYPVTVTKDGNVVTWKPTSTDTAFAGVGSFQLEYTVDSVLAKTCIWSTMVAPSLDPAGDPPDPYDNWLAEMRSIEAGAIQAADDAEDSADAAAASAASVSGITAEVENIRIGADGITYTSAGDAVRGQIDKIATVIEKPVTINLENGYKLINGNDDTSNFHAEIDVREGEKYKIKAQTGSSLRAYVLMSNGSVVDYYNTADPWTTNHDYDIEYQVPQDGTLYVNSVVSNYIGLKELVLETLPQAQVDSIEPIVNSISHHYESENLFNGEYEAGYRSGYGTMNASDTYCCTKPIRLEAGTYLFTPAYSTFGGDSLRVYKVQPDGTSLKKSSEMITGVQVGTKTETDVYSGRRIASFTLSDSAYISINIGRVSLNNLTADQVSNFMLVEGSTIDDFPNYVPYYNYYAVDYSAINGLSGLLGKTAIFDGDSICRGDSVGASEPTYRQGYAGRICNANKMQYKNYSVGGGVITSATNPLVSGKHSVVDTIDTMYAEYPDADLIVFEGGTNDADLLGNAIEDPSRLGTFSETDYSGTYDATSFSGALETIFYKATGYWKGKAIGFIVAQKMGSGYTNFDKDHANRRAYFERAIQICNKWGIPCLNLWDGCYLNPRNANCYNGDLSVAENIAQGYLYTDGQHLTAKGYDYISPIIEDWMKTL